MKRDETIDWRRVERIVDAALDTPPEARTAHVRVLAEGDERVVQAVLDWLGACDVATDFLEAPGAGKRVGRWTLREELGRGGMGTVFLAEAAEGGVTVRAAVKLLTGGALADDIAMRRFHEECRILAGLHHPNIAQLVEVGVRDDAVPWFAMELVVGDAIDRWCDARRLDVVARVGLVATVCEAVAHAHAAGVIHRDLKASNVLVTDDAVPHVIDFGIAKILHGTPAGGAPPITRTGAPAPFTAPCAAPEQLLDDPADERTDVYGLGVLLYVLCAGKLPYGSGRQDRAAMARRIVQGRLVVPSLAFAQPAESHAIDGPIDAPRAAQVAAARGTTPEVLSALLRDGLDAIVARAMSPRPDHRHASVRALEADLRTWLATRDDGRTAPPAPERLTDSIPAVVDRGPFSTRGLLILAALFGAAAGLVLLLPPGR